MTGWLPEVGWMRGCRQAYRSRVRSEIGRRDLGGREGLGGRLRGRRAIRASARRRQARSARATERAVGEDRTGARGGGRGPVARYMQGEVEIEPRWGRGGSRGRVELRGRVEIWVRSGSSLLVCGTFDEI